MSIGKPNPRAGEEEANGGRSLATFLRSPKWMSSLAAFLLIWGLLSGGVAVALLGVCLFYLAWHVGRAGIESTQRAHADAAATHDISRMRLPISRLLASSVAIGGVLGGFQAYSTFLVVGWSRVVAGLTALLVAAVVSGGAWILANKIMTRGD